VFEVTYWTKVVICIIPFNVISAVERISIIVGDITVQHKWLLARVGVKEFNIATPQW
jgi:hypothetical protein